MESCLSIYLGKEVFAVNMNYEDVWTKGCICPKCFDNVYLAIRESKKYIAHCPRKSQYKKFCTNRIYKREEIEKQIKEAKGQTNRSIEKFHRYFRLILESFLPEGEIYDHRETCIKNVPSTVSLDFIIKTWKTQQDMINKYCLGIINLTRSGTLETVHKEDLDFVKNLFNKAYHYQNHTLAVMCVIKYLSQDRARIHLEALFLFCNYVAYSNAVEMGTKYYFDDVGRNIKATLCYMISVIIFCPWEEIADRLKKDLPTEDLSTASIPYIEISEEVLDSLFRF